MQLGALSGIGSTTFSGLAYLTSAPKLGYCFETHLTKIYIVGHWWAALEATASVMQITLKVKSVDTMEGLSHTLSLLEGSESWVVIHMDWSVSMTSKLAITRYEEIEAHL